MNWTDAAIKTAAAGLAGAAVGWGAQGLTLTGRVSAIEGSVGRIEQRVDQLLTRTIEHPPAKPAKD